MVGKPEMTDSAVPMFLYHYTTVESLRAIIGNKTIKFSRADKVNDPYEGFISIAVKEEKVDLRTNYMFCSCWSPLEEESVAMWEIYSNLSGVRIKMRYDMFLPPESGNLVLADIRNLVCPTTLIHPVHVNGIKKEVNAINRIYGPLKVLYEPDMKSLNSAVSQSTVFNEGMDGECVLNDLYLIEKSIRKINHWQYEHEYRYVISPYIEIHGRNDSVSSINNMQIPGYPEALFIPFYKDIEEVILGIEMSDSEEKEIRSFLKENGVENVVKSNIKINRR